MTYRRDRGFPPSVGYYLEKSHSTEGSMMTELAESGSITYVGIALPGSSYSSPVWQIKKIEESNDGVKIMWADGDALYDNIWGLVTTLNYY